MKAYSSDSHRFSLAEYKRLFDSETTPEFRFLFCLSALMEKPEAWVDEICGNPDFSDPDHGLLFFACGVDFTGSQWVRILCDKPQFSKLCDLCEGWNKLTENDWSRLLEHQPRFKGRRLMNPALKASRRKDADDFSSFCG